MDKNFFIRLGILFVLLGFILISIQEVSAYIKNYNEDVLMSQKIASSIDFNYESFQDSIIGYKKSLEDTYELFDLYLDDFEVINKKILSQIELVNHWLEKTYSYSFVLYDSCQYDLSNKLLKSKCNNFYLNYVGMIDSYKKMINKYNDIVSLYNHYISDSGKSSISLYDSYNQDLYLLYKHIYTIK